MTMKDTQKKLQEYHTPQVTDYGNIKQITLAIANTNQTDGGTRVGRKRTS
jgi:hypothetical protein